MSFQDQLKALTAGIIAGAPHLKAAENAVNQVADLVAVAVPSTAPVVAAIESAEKVVNVVVDEVVSIANAFEGVPRQDAIVSPIPQTPTPVPVIDAVPTTVNPAPVDNATLAAGSVASTEGAPSDIFSRLMALENFAVQVAPIVGKIAAEIGL
jgi:hypothetical protein